MTLTVRAATVDDAAAIAHVRVTSWRVAYAGLIPQEILDALDAETEASRRTETWVRRHTDTRVADLVAEDDGIVVGWAAVGPSEVAELPNHGQLCALYALPEHWDNGVGHVLMTAVEEHLRAAGYTAALLWVLEGNERAARFYERHGWSDDGATLIDDRTLRGELAHALRERRRVKTL